MDASNGRKPLFEESPGSIGQGCRLTAGEGDFKDSATEINRRFAIMRNGKGGTVR